STLVPAEDQGSVFVVMSLPPASSMQRTNEVRDALARRAMDQFPAIDDIVAFSGFDFLSSAPSTSSAVAFVSLKPWNERAATSFDVVSGLMKIGFGIPQAQILALNPPPISGLSRTGGFTGYVQNLSGADYKTSQDKVGEIVAEANQRPELQNVRTTLETDVPRYFIDVDRAKALDLGVSLTDLFSTMQATFGSLYVNDFTMLARNFQANLQSAYDFRARPEDLRYVFVRSRTTGDMIPIASLVETERTTGASVVQRFNVFPAAKIMGDPAPGYSSGDAIAAMEDVVDSVQGSDYELAWTGTAYFEKRAGA